jgi:hypothetical protein
VTTQSFLKFCPVCKLSNEAGALICAHCGASLDKTPTEPKTTQQVGGPKIAPSEKGEQFARELSVPAEGMALYVTGSTKPIAVRKDEEFIIGRIVEGTSAEPIVDLADLAGFAMGVSRRHVMVRSTADGYVAIDLNSTNGTWLNGERLVPTKPYALPSGAFLQLGRMRLIVIYQLPSDAKKKKAE